MSLFLNNITFQLIIIFHLLLSHCIVAYFCHLLLSNPIISKDFEDINKKILKKILKYNLQKYPQASEGDTNQEMNDMIVERNDIEDPDNDLFSKLNV